MRLRRRWDTPILVCFDVEPDPRAPDRTDQSEWDGFERLYEFASRVRPALEEASGAAVRFNWFVRMDPQIEEIYGSAAWVVDRYGELLAGMDAAGDEIGLHIHPWRLIDGDWVADFVDAEWGVHCVDAGFEAFAEAMGRPCRSIRFGDRWLTAHGLAAAERHGARFDLTAEPGRRPSLPPEPTVGLPPDYSHTPHRPYRPDPADPTRPSDSRDDGPWMIPLTTHPLTGFGQRFSHRRWLVDDEKDRGGGPYRGWLDVADCESIAGWALDDSAPETPVDVAVFSDGRCIAVVTASGLREDLVAAGIGPGRHGFHLPVGDLLRDGKRHEVTARIIGTDHVLGGGPAAIRCSPPPPAEDYHPLNLYFDAAVICQSLDALVVADRPHLSIVARSDVIVSETEAPEFHATFEHLPRVARAARGRFVTPSEALDLLPRRRLGAKAYADA